MFADHHDDMNVKVFGDWFENVLLPKLPKERNVAIVMGNGNYHSRFAEKTLSMNMKKDIMNKFLVKHNIDIPNPIPTKPMLPEKILERNVLKQYVIDSFTKKFGYDVPQLPPYYCASNPMEMVENRLKWYAFHLNVYTSQSSKVEE